MPPCNDCQTCFVNNANGFLALGTVPDFTAMANAERRRTFLRWRTGTTSAAAPTPNKTTRLVFFLKRMWGMVVSTPGIEPLKM